MTPGVRMTEHPWVGRAFRILDPPLPGLVRMRGESGRIGYTVGECVSVTAWGSNRIRWVRLRHHDGTEKSYAPSHLRRLP